MEEYTGAVRRSIDGGIYWSSEEVNRWRNHFYTGAVRRIYKVNDVKR